MKMVRVAVIRYEIEKCIYCPYRRPLLNKRDDVYGAYCEKTNEIIYREGKNFYTEEYLETGILKSCPLPQKEGKDD